MPSMRALYCPLRVPSMRACRNAENLPSFCSGTAKSQLRRILTYFVKGSYHCMADLLFGLF